MSAYECSGYVQTNEKGASLSTRDACLKCGRTKAAHEPVVLREREDTPYEEATEWLKKQGVRDSFFDLARQILVKYIEEQRRKA
jgi:hypothetical protein